MTIYIYSFIAILGFSINSYSQDVITPTIGEDIEAKIIEVDKTDITYREYDSQDGPILTISKSDVLIISYENGNKEVLFKQVQLAEETMETKALEDSVEIEEESKGLANITLISGEDIQAKVLEVNKIEIVYKRSDDISGLTLTIPRSNVLIISYADGTKDLIYKQLTPSSEVKETEGKNVQSNSEPKPAETVKLFKAELRKEGIQDSKMNYTGRRSGAVWTAATSIVFSPIAGLIPAVACASSRPRERNLNYSDTELKKDPEYKKAYENQAHKTKAVKVAAGYVIGSTAWILLIFGL